MPVASRLSPFGTTVFAEISAAAQAAGATDLGQGAPDFDGPDWIKDAAARAMRERSNQYAPMPGAVELRQAIADGWTQRTGLACDPGAEVTVTNGATEGIVACTLGLLEPGDAAVVFEPFYDSYRPALALAGAEARYVALQETPGGGFGFDAEEFASAVRGRSGERAARAVILNTPHNPTGKVFSRAELETIARECLRHDALVIADEVYDRLVFPDTAPGPHVSIASLDGMRERTVTLGSLGKTFSLTGWKIGWAVGPAELTRGVRAAHQFLTFAVAAPLQHAAAEALRAPAGFYEELVRDYVRRREILAGALREAGLAFRMPEGAYFLLADHRPISEPLGIADDVGFVKHLIASAGVAAIPPTAFYQHKELGRHLVRFAFCKREETLRRAAERLAGLRAR